MAVFTPMTWPSMLMQRAAGVAGIDGGIGLDEVLELALRARLDGAVLGGDDAGGDGLRKLERLADGDHPFPYLRAVGVAHLHCGQGARRIDFDDRDVGVGIDADDFRGTAVIGGIVRIGGELDKDFVRLVHHVIVGDDVAARIDDEAGAERFTNATAIRAAAVIRSLSARSAEEAVEEVLEIVVRTLLLLLIVVAAALLVVGRLRIVWVAMGVALRAATAAGAALVGQGLGVDIHDRGTTSLAICVNCVPSCTGLGIFSGVASELLTWFSLPFTPWTATEPMRMPAERVDSTTNVGARRLSLIRLRKEFICRSNLVSFAIAVASVAASTPGMCGIDLTIQYRCFAGLLYPHIAAFLDARNGNRFYREMQLISAFMQRELRAPWRASPWAAIR